MANPLRKTMVYLGLADEDYEDATRPVRSRRPRAPSTQSSRAPVTPLRRP